MTLFLGLPRIRRSVRAFARAPGLSIALLLTIALGVGSNTAVYGFLQGLTHPASPLPGSDQIVSIFQQDRAREAGPLSRSDYQLLNNSQGLSDHGLFEWIGSARIKPADAQINGRSEVATVAAVTPNLARALALPQGNGAVVSHRVWQTDFDASANILGSHVRVEDADFTISGVAPEHLDGLYSDQSVDLWIPAKDSDLQAAGPGGRDLWVLARLRRGVSMRQAQTALRSASPELSNVSLAPFTGFAPNTERGLTRVTLFLNFSAAAVLLIACFNVASFLLGRAFRRSHETSLRIALGATRAELLRDLFVDSVVISVAGGALGLFLGILTARALPAFLFEADAERLTFAPHLLPILAASFVCIVLTILCGMLPVFGTVTDRPWTVLQRETGMPSKAIQRLRSALVIGQITASCMLVVCTALLLSSLHAALKTGAGRRLGNPVLLTVQAATRPEVVLEYFTRVEQTVRSLPGLSPLAWTNRLPGNQPAWRTFKTQQASLPSRDVVMDIAWLTPDSLQFLDSQPIAGKMFGAVDPSRRIAVVDELAAAQLFGPQTVGLVIRDSDHLPIEIIGVIRRESNDASQLARPTIYYGYLDQSEAPRTIKGAHFQAPVAPFGAPIELSANVVSAGYFRALDMPLIAGQSFRDDRISGAARVAVVNQEAADLYFHGKPIGVTVIDNSGLRTTIGGVVRSQVFGTFERQAEPTIYFPMSQDSLPRMTLLIRTSKWSNRLATGLHRTIENVPDSGTGSIAIRTLDEQLAQSGLAPLRIATLIGSASASIALLLCVLGLISAQGDAERQRRRDRALRVALGAQRSHIVFLVMKSAGRLALVGTAIGACLSLAVMRVFLADIAAVTSPPLQVWIVALFLPAAAVLIASLLPARRASAISPSSIMRDS